MEDTRLGSILLESGTIREDDLERCLEIQALTNGTTPLGQILIEQGAITSSTLDDLLSYQELRRTKSLGSMSVPGSDSDRFLNAALSSNASELHLSEGRPPLMRIAGELRSLSDDALAGPEVWQFVRDHMGAQVLEEIAEKQSVAQGFRREGVGRGRITAYRHFDGIGVSIRLHPAKVRSAEQAGIDSRIGEAILVGKGLILLTGEHGSGISETMSTLLEEASKEKGRFILVLDDNLEYSEPSGDAIVTMRRVGVNSSCYATGLKAALREDPDVIFVADATDPEAFNVALQAAETGKLVIAAVNARSTTAALQRVVAFYAKYDQQRVRTTLASVLVGILAVRLVPDVEHVGLRMATELLMFEDSVREVLRSGSFQQLRLLLQMGETSFGHSLDSSLKVLIRDGLSCLEDVFPYATDKTQMLQLANKTVSATGAQEGKV